MTLPESEVKKYELKLLEIRKELEAEIAKLKEDLDFGSDTEGSMFDEETDEAEEMANSLPIKRQLEERMNEVLAALKRIEDGSYGVCVKCSMEIEREVLDVMPESTLCKACKKT